MDDNNTRTTTPDSLPSWGGLRAVTVAQGSGQRHGAVAQGSGTLSSLPPHLLVAICPHALIPRAMFFERGLRALNPKPTKLSGFPRGRSQARGAEHHPLPLMAPRQRGRGCTARAQGKKKGLDLQRQLSEALPRAGLRRQSWERRRGKGRKGGERGEEHTLPAKDSGGE